MLQVVAIVLPTTSRLLVVVSKWLVLLMALIVVGYRHICVMLGMCTDQPVDAIFVLRVLTGEGTNDSTAGRASTTARLPCSA